jgi:hypothetical protein
MMSKFLETFGDCGTRNYAGKAGYDWPESGIDGTEAKFIETVNQNGFWTNEANYEGDGESRKLKNLDNEFYHTFGIKYAKAAELFCPNVVKKGFWPWSKPKYDPNAVFCNKDFLNFKKDGRARIAAKLNTVSMDPDLRECMKESAENADRFYPAGQQCLITSKPGGYNNPTLFTAPKQSLDSGGTAIIGDTGKCYVSRFRSTRWRQTLPAFTIPPSPTRRTLKPPSPTHAESTRRLRSPTST